MAIRKTAPRLTLGQKRLLKLATHLEQGKMGHVKFNFRVINCGASESTACGTAGCALGEMPILWPRSWEFEWDVVSPRKGELTYTSWAKWFGVSPQECDALFHPNMSHPLCAPASLPGEATKEQVAARIRSFVAARQVAG